MIDKVVNALGGTVAGLDIGTLGVTFKANTDDLRESPAIEIIRGLIGLGATVRAYDPQGMERARRGSPIRCIGSGSLRSRVRTPTA